MEDHVHMKFAKTLMIILGIWPVKLTGYKLKLYNAYFYITFTYYIMYDISQGAMAFITKGDFVETAGNLGVTIIYVINIYKVLICRSETIKKMINEIEIKEKLILENGNERIKEIYHKEVKSALLPASFYVCLGSIGISLYFITPFVKNTMEKENEFGVKKKHLIFSSWFPFDSNKHYGLAYMIQFFGGFYGYGYIVYIGAFFFYMLKYCIGQIKILQHVFKNLNHYVLEFSQENNLVDAQSYQIIYTKLCIKEHQYIINFVERLDKSIKTFMLLEFIISSFQLSLVVFQLLKSNGFGLEQVAVLSYLVTLCAQLFIFYWNAHEIIIQSTQLSQAVFQCDWYSLDPKVQKMLMFVIRRAQKPLAISIGPIYQVRVDALIGIFKAIYSYVAVIQK